MVKTRSAVRRESIDSSTPDHTKLKTRRLTRSATKSRAAPVEKKTTRPATARAPRKSSQRPSSPVKQQQLDFQVEPIQEEEATDSDSDSDDDLDALVNSAVTAFAPTEKATIQRETVVTDALKSKCDVYRQAAYFDFTREGTLADTSTGKAKQVTDCVVQNVKAEKGKEKIVQRVPCTDSRWFNMQSSVMTKETEQDIQAVKLRNYLDPKRFYKSSDIKGKPKVFQIGTVIEGAHEFKTARLSKKQRAKGVFDEVIKDRKIRDYSKRKFDEIQQTKRSGKKGSYKKKQQRLAPKYSLQ